MGEAKRRRQWRDQNPEAEPMTEAQAITNIPQDIRDDIATAIQSVTLMRPGGTCAITNLLGLTCLSGLGIDASIELGGMVYRAGPDERHDVVAWCGPYNAGMVLSTLQALQDGISPEQIALLNTSGEEPDSRGILGHVWIKLGDELIDFTPGKWRSELDRLLADGDDGFPPITWEVEPPRYIWGPRRDYEKPADSDARTPDPGNAWYMGWLGPAPSLEQLRAPLREAPMYLRIIANNLNAMRIAERLRDAQS